MSVQRPVHKAATHKTTHVTVHKTVHKTTHKTTTHRPTVKKKTATRRVGAIQSNALLMNDHVSTCALLAWWNACQMKFGPLFAPPSDALVLQEFIALGGADGGLYIESILECANRTAGLFGYRLNAVGYGVPFGSLDDHAYGGYEALGIDLDESWLLDIALA